MFVEVAELAEPEHVLVERDPPVERPRLDVADDVVDVVQADPLADWLGRQARGDESGAVVAVVVAAVDEGVFRLAVRADRCEAQRAVVVGQFVRFSNRRRAPCERLLVDRRCVVDREREVLRAVAVLADVGPDRRVWGEPAVTTKRMSPCSNRYEATSWRPVSGPAYPVTRKPNAADRKPAVARALPT